MRPRGAAPAVAAAASRAAAAAPPPASAAAAVFACRLLPQAPADAFERLFAVAFRLLDVVWLERGACYMEFPAVLRWVHVG